jgi:hypothetical protein
MKQRNTTGGLRLASSLAHSFARLLLLAAAVAVATALPASAQHAGHAHSGFYGVPSGSYQHTTTPPPLHTAPAPPHAGQSNVVPARPVAAPSHGAPAQPAPAQPAAEHRAPVVRGTPGSHPTTPANGVGAARGSGNASSGLRSGHLGDWMQSHQNLPPAEQQRALEHEPGFNNLPPDQQGRLRARLQELNSMSPAERQRTLNRIEKMESLTPEQRQQVTRTMGQMRSLPPDQQRGVAQAFRRIRQLPPGQRAAAAQNYGRQLNPQQRDTLNSLIRAEPYLPIQRATPPPAP